MVVGPVTGVVFVLYAPAPPPPYEPAPPPPTTTYSTVSLKLGGATKLDVLVNV
jgi:hypothetical protein